MEKPTLIIFGVKNMALEIKEIAETFFAEQFSEVKTIFFTEKFVKENNLDLKSKYYYIVGFGGSGRGACLEMLKTFSNFEPISIIHPSAVISKSARIGSGCLIMPQVTVSTNAVVGDNCVLNYACSIGHDSILKENIFIQPGARISGNCLIGQGSLVGSNAFVYQNVEVGEECLIDALTYVHENLPARTMLSSRYKEAVSRDNLEKGKIPMWE